MKHIRDIDDLPVLQFLAALERGEIAQCYNTGGGLTVWHPNTATLFDGFSNSILNALPYGREYPDKLRRAKVKSMLRKGLIDGCACGCRGDFELTDKGRQILKDRTA